jgi:glycine/D-amino acid oxidase-like deaminating enzyme/nitrite reductase/ring-hydroxylating ferredoxin subunit
MPEISSSPIWKEGLNKPHFRRSIKGEFSTDVVVVGAGITGLTTAYLLAREGRKVIVLDKENIVSGDSSRTTAFLNYASDAKLSELVHRFGERKAVRVWQSMQNAITTIEDIVRYEQIDCEFKRCPLYYYSASAEDVDFLKQEYNLICSLGFPASFTKDLPDPFGCAMILDNNAKFHPLKYLYALAQKIEQYGGRIYEYSEVTGYEHRGGPVVKTSHARIHAKKLVLASHNPNNLAMEVHTRLKPFQTYVIAGKIPKNKVTEGLYIDTYDPYHFFRVDSGEKHDRFLLGGEDHETGKASDTQKAHQILENYLQKILPDQQYEITNQWSGQVISTIDGLPFIGKLMLVPGPVYAATGFAGDDMTFGTLSAKIIAETILKRPHPWADLYSTRLFKGLGEFLKVNYNFIREYIKGRRKIPTRPVYQDLSPESGSVVREHGRPVAIYKNPQGEITKLSAVCSHLGCIVKWNNQAKTWDCPCHGSRFKADGQVLNGPAHKPLPPVEN